jgi:hypothetical protein
MPVQHPSFSWGAKEQEQEREQWQVQVQVWEQGQGEGEGASSRTLVRETPVASLQEWLFWPIQLQVQRHWHQP